MRAKGRGVSAQALAGLEVVLPAVAGAGHPALSHGALGEVGALVLAGHLPREAGAVLASEDGDGLSHDSK